jgi:hypothetical protein
VIDLEEEEAEPGSHVASTHGATSAIEKAQLPY